MTDHEGVTSMLATWTADLRFEDLPVETVTAGKLDLLDTIGCALAGASTGSTAALERILETVPSEQTATVWGSGRSAMAPDAALINGTAAHSLEFDDTHDGVVIHAGVVMAPAVLATARQATAAGREIVTSLIAGTEVAARVGRASTVSPNLQGWLQTPLCGHFGAAAAAAHQLGATPAQTTDALGIAYAQVAGNGQATLDGAQSKRLQAGLAARSGVLSALLAVEGVTGAHRVFDGARGYFSVYHQGRWDPAALLDGLGSQWETTRLTAKPYPCCRWTHAAAEAAFELADQGLGVADIERVDIEVNQQSYNSTGSEPERRQRPSTVIEAQFSIPYVFASALIDRQLTLDAFQPESIMRPDRRALAERVWPGVFAADAIGSGRGVSGARVTVTTRTGATRSVEVAEPGTIWFDTAHSSQLQEKFLGLCDFAGIASVVAAELVEVVMTLEDGVAGDLSAAIAAASRQVTVRKTGPESVHEKQER